MFAARVRREMRRLQEEEGAEQQVDELTATTMCLHYECIKRNKRLLLIYMCVRLASAGRTAWGGRQSFSMFP